jgi:predicted kinase
MKYLRVALVGLGLGVSASMGVAADRPQKNPGDARVERKIEARFEQDGKLAGRQLDAQASGGTVTLVGRVASEQDRARAESLARVKGVTTVDNRIEVESTAATAEAAATPGVTATPANPQTREAARQAERRALSDPYRKNAQVESEPFRTKGSREDFMQSTGLQDPKAPQQTKPEANPPSK